MSQLLRPMEEGLLQTQFRRTSIPVTKENATALSPLAGTFWLDHLLSEESAFRAL
jgi:hypothetical protein